MTLRRLRCTTRCSRTSTPRRLLRAPPSPTQHPPGHHHVHQYLHIHQYHHLHIDQYHPLLSLVLLAGSTPILKGKSKVNFSQTDTDRQTQTDRHRQTPTHTPSISVHITHSTQHTAHSTTQPSKMQRQCMPCVQPSDCSG